MAAASHDRERWRARIVARGAGDVLGRRKQGHATGIVGIGEDAESPADYAMRDAISA